MSIKPNIYLQVDLEGKKVCDWLDGITWCEDRINDNDIKYTQASLIEWYFETMDAMTTVRSLLLSMHLSSKRRQLKRYGAYRRLAIMAGEAESDLRELL